MAEQSLLIADAISKNFSGIAALSEVSLEVGEHELVGLIGPNGAGKTTLFNCLFGILKPDAGQVRFAGRSVTGLPTYKRARLGFGRTFQRIELFAGLTPRLHLLIAARAPRARSALWRDVLGISKATPDEQARAAATLELLGLDNCADDPIETLSLGRGRLVEVGRALMTEPRLLLLDEPSSGLDRRETVALTATLKQVHAERGTAVLLVEHDIEMVREFVQRIYVLDFGTIIAKGPTAEVFADARVREAYLGELATAGGNA
jgi:branched-chain amino acid transport system ATP-binding protein